MSFNFIFVSFIILCFFEKIETEDNNITNKNIKLADPYLNIQNSTNTENIRKLEEEFRDLKINADTSILESNLKDYDQEVEAIKSAVEEAITTLKKIIKIKTSIKTNSIKILDYIDKFNSASQKTALKGQYTEESIIDTDVLIFIRTKGIADTMDSFAKIMKFKTDDEGRVLVGCIIYDYMKDYDNSKTIDYTHRKYLLTILFMHEFIHFLGFDYEILKRKGIVDMAGIDSRIKGNSKWNRAYVKNVNVVNFAKNYFKCDRITQLEFVRDFENEKEDLPNSHWEGRLFLGDIMTLDLYYPEQVISEFTLTLLDQLGWYQIKNYTGGLMKYGKGEGCEFLEKDCIDLKKNQISFSNEFCEKSFGTCSFGRQSRSYCENGKAIADTYSLEYTRNSYTKGYGLEIAEYCPISVPMIEAKEYKNYYYIGSCSIGDGKYGTALTFLSDEYSHKYEDFNAFEEVIGNNSFCALSSILKRGDNDQNYKNLIRPTCYEMSCSEKSLTITIGSEYIVCPRYGGLVKVGGKHTNYVGYLYCPDYNLICSGTILCNNIFDCIDKKSEYNKTAFNKDYYLEINYNSEIGINKEGDIDEKTISDENYELSENGKCPLDCSQCIYNKRCMLCGHSKGFYIGENELDLTSNINCSSDAPGEGFYKRNETHYFKCVDGCKDCQDRQSCSYCFPQFNLSNDKTKCIERIPHCKTYDKSSTFMDYSNNGGHEGYQTCLECDKENNYYCKDMNKEKCEEILDIETYYSLEPNKNNPCMGDCKVKYPNCIRCNINTCIYCDRKFYFNDSHDCTERIPNCEIYDENSLVKNDNTNNGGEGYRKCEKCKEDHYCMREDKAVCQEIKNLTGYYDYGNTCKDECKNIYTSFCLECVKEKCINCITRSKMDKIHCVEGIDHCVSYVKDSDKYLDNDTYIECSKCDEDKQFYCIDNIRTICKNVNISLYYKLEEGKTDTCYRSCDNKFDGCATCKPSECDSCKDHFEMIKGECILKYEQKIPDDCRVVIHEINDDIEEIDFEELIKKYFADTYSYLNTVYLYVNKKYTISIFINSDCTASLLDLGYYKIDSKDLHQKVVNVIGLRTERHEFFFHCFIQYNNNNHYRFHNYNSKYVVPKGKSEDYADAPFILTNKYNNTISVALGSIIASSITLDKLDIFSEDSEVFTDLCQNVTLEGVDIPISERLHYLYMGGSKNIVACGGEKCELLEVKKEESISVCKCILNEYDDLFNETQIKIEKPEQPELKSSPSDSFGIIKCAKNGFHANNVKSNGGFYICLFVIVGVGVLILCYFLCSKIITTSEKGMNPPSKVKNRLRIISNWDKTEEERKKMKKFNEEVMNDFQPRDGHEDELTEEEKDYS